MPTPTLLLARSPAQVFKLTPVSSSIALLTAEKPFSPFPNVLAAAYIW